MQEIKPYMTRKDIPDKVYWDLFNNRRYVDYLLKIIELTQLPAFDDVHRVRYERIPGQWAKGWQIISKLNPDRNLRLFLKSSVASPKHPFYYMVFYVPTQVYECFVDGEVFGFGKAYLCYDKKQESNLAEPDRYFKTLSDSCIQALKDASKRQKKRSQTPNVCLQDCGYEHLSDNRQQTFDMLSCGSGGDVEDLVRIIETIYQMTDWYGENTRNA